MGPAETIAFSDAAITWASFYHLMFNHDPDVMKRDMLLLYGEHLSTLFSVPLNLYWYGNQKKVHEKLIRGK